MLQVNTDIDSDTELNFIVHTADDKMSTPVQSFLPQQIHTDTPLDEYYIEHEHITQLNSKKMSPWNPHFRFMTLDQQHVNSSHFTLQTETLRRSEPLSNPSNSHISSWEVDKC